MPFPDIDPIAISLGPIDIRWYALAYLFGIFLAGLYGITLLNKKSLWVKSTPPFDKDSWWDFIFWAVIGIIVGGRLGYVIFYNPAYYFSNPMEILKTWDGGMSFHGGLIGISIALILFLKKKKVNPLSGLDLLACVAPIGIFLGRMSNFINGELFGRETNLPWGVIFPHGGDMPRHPSQLYEAALEGIVLFLVIRYVTHIIYGLRKPGLVAGIFAIGYGLSRILVETVRLPDADKGYLFGGWLTYGMVLTLPMVFIGIALIIYANRKAN
ncbi:MAG: prolipoprotein diacylglyceryl transferase [Devosiaceae bacterium]|nr:prolipoprotein diacylglyceryl transferase [Devosiaceae bacterium]